MSSHRAWQCHAFGDYHDLTLEQVTTPLPAAGEILVANQAYAPGFPDMLMVQGGYQLRPQLPFTPCAEFAGEVIAVGAGVDDFALGDRVMGGVRFGAAAERVIADAAACLPLPPAWDMATGSAYLVAYKTAWVGLVVRGTLAPGETVLVHGAAGGVGLAAVDLARHLGAKVIGMASGADKLDAVRAAGADHALDYRDGEFRTAVKDLTGGRGADVIYDPVGGDVFDQSIRCIAPFGRLLVIGFASGRIPEVAVNYALIKQIAIVGVRAGEYGRVDAEGGRRVHAALGELAQHGSVTPHVHARLPGDDLPGGYDTIARREVIGRVALTW